MKKKCYALALTICLLITSVVYVFGFASQEVKKQVQSEFFCGKYVYYQYNKNDQIDSYVIVDKEKYTSFNQAATDSSTMVSLEYQDSTATMTRFEKEHSKWVSKEKREYIQEEDGYKLNHYRFIDQKLFWDSSEKTSINKDGLPIEYTTQMITNGVVQTYSVIYEYNDQGLIQKEYHYLNNELDHTDSYEYANNRLVSSVVDREKTVCQYDQAGNLCLLNNTKKEPLLPKMDSLSPLKEQSTKANSKNVVIYKYNRSLKLPFRHMDFSTNGITTSYGTNTVGFLNYVNKLLHRENGYIFESQTDYWTSREEFKNPTTTTISMTSNDFDAVLASIIAVKILTTEDDGSSSDNVTRYKVNKGKYQYYSFTSANCATFVLDLIRGVIPERVDAAGRSLWGSKYNFSGIYTVDKAFTLLSHV